jgi:serine protease Do
MNEEPNPVDGEPTPASQEPIPAIDASGPAAAPGDPAADPMDDTQRFDVPRYAPAPDPRPDARWAWASPSSQPPVGQSPVGRWHEPAPPEPSALPGGQGTGAWDPGSTAWSQGPGWSQGSGWNTPTGTGGGSTPPPTMWNQPVTPVEPPAPRRRRGSGMGMILVASLLSAVLASGGTVLVLDRTGALDRTVINTLPSGTSQTTGNQQPVTIDESSAVINAAAKVGPAVVKITTEGQSGDPFGGGTTEGVGSGIIYDANGWILTNHHVVSGADQLTVELKDGRQFTGTVYGIDTLTDLAIVKVDATGLPTAPIGRSDGLKVGQLVIAIGSPLGMYSFSVTSGIVSGKGRDIQVDSGQRITNLIQTDAAINPGNSGGPLVDAGGSVVGVNTAVATDSSGIGFAIPIDIARPIMDQAVKGETLARPWIGIRFISIDLQEQAKDNLPVDKGAYVTASGGTDSAVVANSPADKAGIKDGDIITAINGTAVDTEHPLDALLVQFSPGDTVVLDVLRDGATIQVNVTLGTRPNNL